MRYTDPQLVELIATSLTDYQAILIEKSASGLFDFQEITPSVTLTYEEIRKMTHRTRIRTAMVEKLVGLLEAKGLDVDCGGDFLVITKLAEDLPTEFDSVRELERFVKQCRGEEQAA